MNYIMSYFDTTDNLKKFKLFWQYPVITEKTFLRTK